MHGKPFIRHAKEDERTELLRRLAVALGQQPVPGRLASFEKPVETPKNKSE